MKEIWRDIKEFEGLYQISNLGRVKSLRTWIGGRYIQREKILAHEIKKNGYYKYALKRKGIQTNKYEHRLVAEAFIPNPNNYPCVNHKDENKTNNCVDNLEWCTYKYNNNYGNHKQNISIGMKNNPKISKKINQYNKNGNFIKEWESTMEIERQLKICNSHISECCRGICKTAGGFIWKYQKN